MSLIGAIIVGLAMGIVFGFALEKSRVFEPGISAATHRHLRLLSGLPAYRALNLSGGSAQGVTRRGALMNIWPDVTMRRDGPHPWHGNRYGRRAVGDVRKSRA
jgi:hypothetical protein